jgi:hypothetical protein
MTNQKCVYSTVVKNSCRWMKITVAASCAEEAERLFIDYLKTSDEEKNAVDEEYQMALHDVSGLKDEEGYEEPQRDDFEYWWWGTHNHELQPQYGPNPDQIVLEDDDPSAATIKQLREVCITDSGP